ncbi:MAG: hypothetical protein FH748_17350 [Balneolaceae bacterium]|nr:hypothetical protein [Balneolaceae bacterium]
MNYAKPILFSIIFVLTACSGPAPSTQENEETTIKNPEYGHWQDSEHSPLNFTKTAAYGTDENVEEALLTRSTDVFTDKDLNLYVLDSGGNRLVCYTPDGNLKWVTGKEGEGPGDFTNARNMTWDGDNSIYIENMYGSRIDQFDLNGDFINSFTPPQLTDNKRPVSMVGFMEGKLVLSKGVRGGLIRTFLIVDPEKPTNIIRSFTVDITEDMEIPETGSSFSDPSIVDNQLVTPGMVSYKLQFYNADSTKTKTVIRNMDKLVSPVIFKDEGGVISVTLGGINPVLKLNEDYYITSASWPLDIEDPEKFVKEMMAGKIRDFDNGNTIDLYNSKWELLYSLESDGNSNPDLGTPIHIDQKGYMYSSFLDPFPHIKKFKVTITAPNK